MKTEAFRCDSCLKLYRDMEVHGFNGQLSIFTDMSSFESTNVPQKGQYHFCLDCYREKVLNPVSMVTNRAKDEKGYNDKLQEYIYLLKKSCVLNYKKEE